jgi:hypothetical protein
MSTKTLVLALGCSALMFGCSAEESDIAADNREIIDNLIVAGFPQNEIMVVDDVVYVGRDAAVSLEASREMIEVDGSTSHEQYRTSNLVSRNLATICVNGAAFAGNQRFSQALDLAITNYNNLGLTFRMQRTTSSNGCQATITARFSSGTGGSSGFPSGGRPFGTINIGTGLQSFSVDTIEHVITHEIGHTVGFRHSDFFNRSISCGQGGNEGNGGVGAILIPGTPSGAQVGGSIMNSCFRSSESGEFTGSDVTALQTLY